MKIRKYILGLLALLAFASGLRAQATDPMAEITSTITAIDTMWGTIAVIVIAVAAVMVGVRFLKKLGH